MENTVKAMKNKGMSSREKDSVGTGEYGMKEKKLKAKTDMNKGKGKQSKGSMKEMAKGKTKKAMKEKTNREF